LKCSNGHEFESWFRNAASFDDQVAQDRISCPTCQATGVDKAIMAPAVISGAGESKIAVGDGQQLRAEIRAFRQHVLAATEDVGTRFPQECRKIAEGEAHDRPIRGQSTLEEARTLLEEGIYVLPLPSLPEDMN
jgi:hypothetical protein